MKRETKEQILTIMIVMPLVLGLFVVVGTLVSSCILPTIDMNLFVNILLWDFYVWVGLLIISFGLALNWRMI